MAGSFPDAFPPLFPLCNAQQYEVRMINSYFTKKQTELEGLVLGSQLAGGHAGSYSSSAKACAALRTPPCLPRGCGQWYSTEPLAVT